VPYCKPGVALANQAIDHIRRVLAHTLQREDARVLKGRRFLLLRGFEHLADDARERLGASMKLNRPRRAVHVLKEQLRLFWRLPNVAAAKAFLYPWTPQG
jgi:transposase